MPDILHKVGIKSSSLDDVYKALATVEGLSRWWTTDTKGESTVGGVIQFRFGSGGFDMKVLALQLENLHVETAVTKAELEHAANLAFAARVARPPARKAFDGGQCRIDILRRGRFDSDLMQNVRHICLFFAWC